MFKLKNYFIFIMYMAETPIVHAGLIRLKVYKVQTVKNFVCFLEHLKIRFILNGGISISLNKPARFLAIK